MIAEDPELQSAQPTAEIDRTTSQLTNLMAWRLKHDIAADSATFPANFKGYDTLWKYEVCKGMTVRWVSKADPANSFKGLILEAVHDLDNEAVKITWDVGAGEDRAVTDASYDELVEIELSIDTIVSARTAEAIERSKATKVETIARLNDEVRAKLKINSPCLSLTMGILSLGRDELPRIVEGISTYESFGDGEDPFSERDFGVFDLPIGDSKEKVVHKIAWKIDYYDNNLELNSPDPANPAFTCRIITVSIEGEFN
jgi:Protein of unknown function (DUF3768)